MLADELLGPASSGTADEASADAIERLDARLSDARAPMAVVVLDEMDHLTVRDQEVLYRVFEWAARPASRLVLIGVLSQRPPPPRRPRPSSSPPGGSSTRLVS